MDDTQTKLLALLILCDGNVLDVTDLTQAVDAVVGTVSTTVSLFVMLFLQDSQLPLNDQSTSTNNLVLAVEND